MVYSVEQNTFIVSYFRIGLLMMNGYIHYLFVKINYKQNMKYCNFSGLI
jgi:hypothetical protein